MAFESGDFQYQISHFPAPGTPGQGTRNSKAPFWALLPPLYFPNVHVEMLTRKCTSAIPEI